MKSLKTLLTEAVVLSATQKSILASCVACVTPQLAYEAASGTEALSAQREQLSVLGLLFVQDNSIQLTDAGNAALIANNIVDETGQLTDSGKSLVELLKTKKVNENATYNTSVYMFLQSLASLR